MRFLRIDTATLGPVKRQSNGRIIAEGYLARSGIQEYYEGGTVRKEYRPPNEVFKRDAIESFEGVPLTNNHPRGLLNADARGYTVGTISKVCQDGDKIRAQITVFDRDTIQQMESGKVYLSAGYQVELDRTPGVTPDGEKYDAVQRCIIADHVALVDRGRAGPQVRVRMDSQPLIPDRKTILIHNLILARR